MISTVCIGCGLTTDSSGNLIAHTAGTAKTACSVVNGTPVNCNAAGQLVGPPEKFYQADKLIVTALGGGQHQLTAYAPDDGVEHNIATGVGSITFTNPSPCLAMQLRLESGVAHAAFRDFSDFLPVSRVFIDTKVTMTGAIAFAQFQTGHQIWAAPANGTELDTKHSTDINYFVLPAGGTVTFSVQGAMTVFAYDGNTVLENVQWILDVQGWSLGAGQTGITK